MYRLRALMYRPVPPAADTEEYLHKLASKIANVKMSAEIDKAAARAKEEARAKVGGAVGGCCGRVLWVGWVG